MPLSSDAKISGWSASNDVSVLCCCSCPRPKKLWTSVLLCVPFCHLHDARHVNFVASGRAFQRLARVQERLDIDSVVDCRCRHLNPPAFRVKPFSEAPNHTRPDAQAASGAMIPRMATTAPKAGAGSAGVVETAVPRFARAGPARLRPGAPSHPHRVRNLRYAFPGPGQRDPRVPRAERRRARRGDCENPAAREHPGRLWQPRIATRRRQKGSAGGTG